MKPDYTLRVLILPLRFIWRQLVSPILIPATILSLSGLQPARAEGTKSLMPNSGNGTGLIVSTTTSFPLGNVGSYLGSPKDNHLCFYINDPSKEVLYYAFNWETLGPQGTNIVPYTDVYMNIYDPDSILVANVHLPSTGAGYMSSYGAAIQFPKVGGVPSYGYDGLTFTPSKKGDYFVTFYRGSNNGRTHISGGESMLGKWWDMTVVSGTARLSGRVHCNEWAFSVYNPAPGKNDIQDPAGSTNASFYSYTPDSVVLQVNFPPSGFEPLAYIISFNDFGVQADPTPDDWLESRRSIVLQKLVSPYLTGGYPVFLNPPDPNIYPLCSVPQAPILLAPVISGCPPGPYDVRFMAPQSGDYYLLFDLNGTPGYQPGTKDLYIELVGEQPGVVTYVWNGRDGLGNLVPANTTFPITFTFRKGRINIPFYDVELNLNGFAVKGYAPPGSPLATNGVLANPAKLFWDDTKIQSLVNGVLGSNTQDCSTSNNNNFTGVGYDNSVIGLLPDSRHSRAWSGNGNPNNTIPADSVLVSGQYNNLDQQQCDDYGNARLLNTWAWGVELPSTQILTLTCINVSGTVWDDANNSANNLFTNPIYTNGEHATNAGGTVYASLVDPITNNVISSVAVDANGNYTLPNCPVNTSGMEIFLSTVLGVAGQAAPTPATPADWVNTTPLIRTFSVTNINVTGLDFGIEQLPNSDDQNYTIAPPVVGSLLPLNGFGTITSPGPLTGSDPEDGTMGPGKKVMIDSIPANENLFYNNAPVTAGTTITNYIPSLLAVQFTTISTLSTAFKYSWIDAGGKKDSTPATYTINMSIVLSSTLNSFTGRNTDYGNVLSWVSFNETHDNKFTIQRSANGTNFAAIGQVNGIDNGDSINHSFTDGRPIPNTPNYYRLQWTDSKGDIAYSNIVQLTSSSISEVLDVSPNPFRDQVIVRMNLPGVQPVVIHLLDSKGVTLRQSQVQGQKGANTFVVDGLSSLPPSVYFVQIVLADHAFVKKVFNQK